MNRPLTVDVEDPGLEEDRLDLREATPVEPWVPQPITEVLDRVLVSDPTRVALVGDSGTLTYAELDAAANAAAAAWQDVGVASGDRVAASLPNDVDIVVAFHGAMRLGAIWMGINRNLSEPEQAALLDAGSPSFFLADAGLEEWRERVAGAAGAPRLPSPHPDQPAAIAYTSGTTGLPKGIVHSQRNLLLPGAALVASRGYDETLRKGDCLALTILNMQVLTSLLTAAAGGCSIITDRRDPRGLAEWIARESVTVWNGVPTMLYGMVHDAELDPELLATLQEIWTGGSACPEDLFVAVEGRFGVPVRSTYGLTEAPTVVTMEPVGVPHVAEGAGVALPHLDVQIEDDEVVVRAVAEGPWRGAYTPMLGYWEDGALRPLEDDVLRTGDLGTIDDDGYLFIRDRKKLLIIRGGANVYPAEVERVLATVTGVRGSAVMGVPDERLGERVVAAVEVDPDFVGVDVLLELCRSNLARYKVPEEIVVVEELPRNAMGKVQRALLVDRFSVGPASGRTSG